LGLFYRPCLLAGTASLAPLLRISRFLLFSDVPTFSPVFNSLTVNLLSISGGAESASCAFSNQVYLAHSTLISKVVYNPDLIVIDPDGTHWIVEVKINKEIESEDVQAKRDAAKRWANHVTADEKVGVIWKYLLVSEADVSTSKGSCVALKKLGG
jgi:hypothetical protein